MNITTPQNTAPTANSTFPVGTYNPNACQFCNEPCFTDDRSCGSVRRQKSGGLAHYHLDCLYDNYPGAESYDAIVLGLFSNT